ncbi:MAG: RDD family protein [Candidatus Heimdallarchaeota archaeon]|nr:MAG: RDD family protein [Candidatus Heimdallarchaeota archaeon]
MSTERIKYETSPIAPRLIALIIDLVVIVILAVIFTFLGQIDWFVMQQLLPTFEDIAYTEVLLPVFVLMIIFTIVVYFILVPSFTNGQTVGKIIMGLNVVYDDNSSTKRKFGTHFKRLFFMRGGTKVVKIVDERPEGL